MFDRREVIDQIQRNPRKYNDLDKLARIDYDVALTEVRRSGSMLGSIPIETGYRNRFDFVMAAVENDGMALRSASPELQKNTAIVTAAITENPRAIQFADEEKFRNDPDIMMSLVKRDGTVLKHVGTKLKESEKYEGIARQAIKTSPETYKYVSPHLTRKLSFNEYALSVHPSLYSELPENMKTSPRFAYMALRQSGGAAKETAFPKEIVSEREYTPEYMNTLPEKAMKQVEQLGQMGNNLETKFGGEMAFQFVIKDAIFGNPDLYNELPPALKAKDNVRETASLSYAVDVYRSAVDYGDPYRNVQVPEELRTQTLAKAAAMSREVFPLLNENDRNTKDIAMSAIDKYPGYYALVSTELKRDPDVAKLAFEKDGENLRFAPKDIRTEPYYVALATRYNYENIQYATTAFYNQPGAEGILDAAAHKCEVMLLRGGFPKEYFNTDIAKKSIVQYSQTNKEKDFFSYIRAELKNAFDQVVSLLKNGISKETNRDEKEQNTKENRAEQETGSQNKDLSVFAPHFENAKQYAKAPDGFVRLQGEAANMREGEDPKTEAMVPPKGWTPDYEH